LGRYGHGGRPGYEREWRADPGIAGSGQMLDQRVHLIDLARWFAGDFTTITGHVGSFFWDMPVEDNGFAMLRTAEAQVAWLHASCTEWRNLFSFEIFGRNGKSQIDGLGGSYGIERLTYGRMVPEMGPPDTTIWNSLGRTNHGSARLSISSPALTVGRASAVPPWTRQRRSASLKKSTSRRAVIIVRSPLRVTLGGGGTDLPSYYRQHSGYLIAAAIDRYVYITIHESFAEDLIVKYSRLERVQSQPRCSTRFFGRRFPW
jgi:hypothetical protein